MASTPTLDSALQQALGLSLHTKVAEQGGSVAVSIRGAHYAAGVVGSGTHLLDIPSELAALVRAVHANDVLVTEVHTIITDPTVPISPLVLNILIDHGTRTGQPIRYSVSDTSGKIVFQVDDVRTTLPFYARQPLVLASVAGRVPPSGKATLDRTSAVPLQMQLRKWAQEGCAHNFPTYNSASGYGAAVLTRAGDIYYGGQYSGFDKRTGVHAEMAVLLNALMSGARDITHLGIVSSKFVDTPCSPCGCCRQFISEMCREYHFSPQLCLFAFGNEQYVSYTIDELLPVQWSNKK